ncbi:hypothetical protein [Pseudonocardia sp. HH130630-07]|uniref:hypothetical protein n=1 Tax=Pseudonocardia sp. HH130630-07 TaxID=1690815 RepID=UPI00081525FE|nr:hypothetical protein [Pseudonocardia sp. HH130630-07]ANY06291.1 hypothetical protein AFB00_08270 [Pseudonocardia sp. HH130630-07]
MSRALTERESAVLTAMIERGEPFDPDPRLDGAARRSWLQRVPATRAGARCGCGACPSIALLAVDREGPYPSGRRVVLTAHVPGALLLLVLDDGQPVELELAPAGDMRFPEFPPVGEIRFG